MSDSPEPDFAPSPKLLLPEALTDSLVPETVALTARRLGLTAAIAAGVYVFYIVLYLTVWAHVAEPVGTAMALVGLGFSVPTAAYLLSGGRAAAKVTAVAITYEAFLALSMAVTESWKTVYREAASQVGWSAVVIMLFPFLIPARPRVVLGSSLLAAAMTPVGMLLVFGLTGRVAPPFSVLVSYIIPPFACALLAWAPTSALSQLRAAAQQATRVGSYELIRRLGAGGMGEVWLASHRLLARPAAVKLMKPEVLGAKDEASRETLLRRFEREAQVTANLESPHTIELYDFGVSPDGTLFYVMERLHGVDLETLVMEHGPLAPERVVHLLLQACDSLEDAHQRGLIHRDIKPANMFVTRKGSTVDYLKVLDFGLVKRAGAVDESVVSSLNASLLDTNNTVAGQIVGTPAFMPPEAILGEQAVDCRADVYALGCVAYWMLTGELVFEETTVIAVLTAHLMKQPAPPSERAKWPLAPELERLVLSCLQKDRDLRPASAEVLRLELSRLSFGEAWTRERALAWWAEHLATGDQAGRGLLATSARSPGW
jgi:eukaryotic-like serine/threonine-protein kinase